MGRVGPGMALGHVNVNQPRNVASDVKKLQFNGIP